MSTDTYVSMVTITANNLMVPVGTNSHLMSCLVTLSSSIGPNISALSISWLHNNRIIDLFLNRFNVSKTFGAQKIFTSSLTLSAIRQHDSGKYCCTASIAGNETKSNYCVELKVTTDGEYIAVAETHCNATTPVTISGNFKNLRVGSTAELMCSVPNLTDSTINWLSHDGSVVSSSGALILQSVNYTINGRMFTCSVNSPQLMMTNSINETITVTVQGEHDTNICINC